MINQRLHKQLLGLGDNTLWVHVGPSEFLIVFYLTCAIMCI